MIIGIAGRAGAGKSEVAKYLATKYGYERKHVKEPLAKMLRCLGLTYDEIDGNLKESPCDMLLGATPRQAQVTLGTEWGRKLIHEDLWAFHWGVGLSPLDRVVNESVRFANEAAEVKRLKGIVIRIVGDRALPPPIRWGLLGRLLVRLGFKFPIHPSERDDLIPFDYVIINNQTTSLDELHASIDAIMATRSAT